MTTAHATRTTHAAITAELQTAVATVAAAVAGIPAARRDLTTRTEALAANFARTSATGVSLNGGAPLQARRAELALEALALQDAANAAAGQAFAAVSTLTLRALAALAAAAQALEDLETRKAERDALAAAVEAKREGERRREAELLRERDRLQAAAVAAGTHTWEDFRR